MPMELESSKQQEKHPFIVGKMEPGRLSLITLMHFRIGLKSPEKLVPRDRLGH
jgi:hypothetical protein